MSLSTPSNNRDDDMILPTLGSRPTRPLKRVRPAPRFYFGEAQRLMHNLISWKSRVGYRTCMIIRVNVCYRI